MTEREIQRDIQIDIQKQDFIQRFLEKLKIADIPKGNKPSDNAVNLVHEIINRLSLDDVFLMFEDIAKDWGLWGAIYLSYQSKIFNDEPPLTCPYIKQLF